MAFKKRIMLGMIIILCLPMLSAAHFIVGKANNASDGGDANGRTVVVWNPANGINDNVTDIIGPTGNSGVNNTYMVDCELLTTACTIGDEMRARIINDGFGRTSEYVSVNVTGGGFDVMPNITLNSIPTVTLVTPAHYANESGEVAFRCDTEDLDANGDNVTLYGNWSGGWHANETTALAGVTSSNFFYKNMSDGIYEWNCFAQDNLTATDWADSNRTVIVDSTPPTITSVVLNESYMCGITDQIRVNCTVTDAFTGIDTVTIRAHTPSGNRDHTTTILSGDTYYADVDMNETGSWGFTCIANDTANNTATNTTDNITTHTVAANLKVFDDNITFSNTNPAENENITINTTVYNNGCGATGSFLFGFYVGDPDTGGTQIGNNQTLNIPGRSNDTTNITWLALIGTTNIFVLTDVNDTVAESNESDNKANKTITIQGWQDFYGIINSDKLIANNNSNNIDFWANETINGGNIFVTDSESQINWDTLQAIGRNTTNHSTTNDFTDIDTILNMNNFNDSVANTFTTDGNTPKTTRNITVNNKLINYIPIINSTNNTSFLTGILWDYSDDTNQTYDTTEKEDLVFITRINKSTTGFYGTYDYEISIPAKLREQNTADTTQIYLYYELDS